MVLEFKFINVLSNQPIEAKEVSIDNGKTWLSIDEWVSTILPNNTDPIIFVRHLRFTFRIIESFLLKHGYEAKGIKDHGKGWTPYSPALKEFSYAPKMFSKRRDCMGVRFSNFKMYEAEKWLGNNRNPLKPLTEEEFNFLLALSKIPDLETTPAKEAWKGIEQENNFISINKEIYNNIDYGVQGGIIKGKPGYYEHAFHYDITSLYPFILSTIDNFPFLPYATILTKGEQTNHQKYAYYVYPSFHCDTITSFVPAGSIKVPLIKKNRYKEKAISLYDEKAKYEKSTPEYIVAKLKANSFIGRFKMNTYNNDFYLFTNSDEGKVKRLPYKRKFVQLGEYTYLIAKAREYMIKHIEKAHEQGASILQINTDGFFTDKPIAYDKERFLGSLRFEYEAHNVTIFRCNQYVCDEEICIAGLPKDLYVPGQLTYLIPTIEWDDKMGAYVYKKRKLTLGEEECTYEE